MIEEFDYGDQKGEKLEKVRCVTPLLDDLVPLVVIIKRGCGCFGGLK